MSRKVTYNILVTDHTRIESFASRFIRECRNRSNVTPIGKAVRWKDAPKWVPESHDSLKLNFCSYELEKEWLNLYSFPSAIKRDFWLNALALEFDGVLLIVDLGAKRFWSKQVEREKSNDAADDQSLKSKALAIRDPHMDLPLTGEEALAIWASRLSAFDDPTKIWGVELVNQIKGAKLILAIESSTDCVPVSYVRKYLYLDSKIDIVVRAVDYDIWSSHPGRYSDEIIRETLSILGRKVRRM